MKRSVLILFLTILGLTGYSQTGIGTSTPDASAVLDLSSTTSGFLPPRMTHTQMHAIVSPAEGLMVYCTNCDPKGIYYNDGTEFLYIRTGFVSGVMSNTGKIWMDRNLGATRVATSLTDAASYGDLYQWGRATDGHEIRTSATTTDLATTSVPNSGNTWDGMFILNGSVSPYDWLSPQDNSLWQGATGTNNPCPSGYRVPTSAEWVTEYGTWSSQNAAGAFDSPLKLTLAGYRSLSHGLIFTDVTGYYWSSTVDGTASFNLVFNSGDAYTISGSTGRHAFGFSVRCIKD